MFRSTCVALFVGALGLSGCVAVPIAPGGGTPIAQPPGAGPTPVVNAGVALRGRSLQRPGEVINLFSDGSFAWNGPNGQQSGVWTGGPDRLCLIVQFSGGGSSNYCGISYIQGNRLEFLNDAGGAPVYWNIV